MEMLSGHTCTNIYFIINILPLELKLDGVKTSLKKIKYNLSLFVVKQSTKMKQ